MSQIEISKLSGFVYVGPSASGVTIGKLAAHVLLMPGEDGETPERQGFCYSQAVDRG